jgi:hypothetical protein
MASQGMSRVPILLLASFPKLDRLFFLYKCLPFLWFSLVIFLLLLGFHFGLNLASIRAIWILLHMPLFVSQDPSNHLRWSHASFSLTLWSNCLRPNGQINMVPFSLVAMLVFDLFSKRSFRSTKGFCLP